MIDYVINDIDSNCYVSVYGNIILAKCLHKRIAGTTHNFNNRCLVDIGWRPY